MNPNATALAVFESFAAVTTGAVVSCGGTTGG
jgi:hypothetical protein